MSRSLRKTPVFGHSYAESEKDDKQLWHSRMRAAGRVSPADLAVLAADEDADLDPIDVRAVSNPWDMAKDGKSYWTRPQLARWAQSRAKHRGQGVDRAMHQLLAK